MALQQAGNKCFFAPRSSLPGMNEGGPRARIAAERRARIAAERRAVRWKCGFGLFDLEAVFFLASHGKNDGKKGRI